jgi:hypothetical protein
MNITNPVDNSFKTSNEIATTVSPTMTQSESSGSVFSTILTFIKIVLVLGILFFILYEINKQTNNSIMNYFQNLFKPSSKSSTTQSNTTGTTTTDWMASFTPKQLNYKNDTTLTSSSISSPMKEVPDEISSKLKSLYKVNNPNPDDSTSNIQEKKGYCYIGNWKGSNMCINNYDTCYSGKIYDTKEECMATNK